MAATGLDPHRLIAESESRTGLNNWGGSAFTEGLKAYCDAASGDAGLAPNARIETRDMILRLLSQRLALYRDRSLYPEIADQRIERPLFITGLPRSGSTLLHGLLAQDPRARSIATWEHEDISPPARAQTYADDPRIARTEARIAAVPAQVQAIHAVGARLPDECNFITALAFQSVNLHTRFYANAYVDWYLQADDTPAYEVHRHALQHMQAFCTRDWWVLKSPPHLFHLPRLFATYPDARVVFLHRDPARTLPSITNLFSQAKRRSYADFDARRAGRETLAWWAEGLRRALAFRAGATHASRFFDLTYEGFIASPLKAAARLYDWMGIDLAPAATPMTRFLADHPKDKFGPHLYSAAEYGLDTASLRRHFADYIDAFDIPLEPGAP